ncbi:LOW QUALITY PROTEIN: hypothetical protein U9M48_007707, partial [Paspalum notatum var. saurae]
MRLLRASSFNLVKAMLKCFAPEASCDKRRLISVCIVEESSTLAFSAVLLSFCIANLSLLRSIALEQGVRIKNHHAYFNIWIQRYKKITSKAPSDTSKIDTLNVPPL